MYRSAEKFELDKLGPTDSQPKKNKKNSTMNVKSVALNPVCGHSYTKKDFKIIQNKFHLVSEYHHCQTSEGDVFLNRSVP